jgi:hypothetical protein
MFERSYFLENEWGDHGIGVNEEQKKHELYICFY